MDAETRAARDGVGRGQRCGVIALALAIHKRNFIDGICARDVAQRDVHFHMPLSCGHRQTRTQQQLSAVPDIDDDRVNALRDIQREMEGVGRLEPECVC